MRTKILAVVCWLICASAQITALAGPHTPSAAGPDPSRSISQEEDEKLLALTEPGAVAAPLDLSLARPYRQFIDPQNLEADLPAHVRTRQSSTEYVRTRTPTNQNATSTSASGSIPDTDSNRRARKEWRQQRDRFADRVADSIYPGLGRVESRGQNYSSRLDYIYPRRCGVRGIGICYQLKF